jgi:hypothetical protein
VTTSSDQEIAKRQDSVERDPKDAGTPLEKAFQGERLSAGLKWVEFMERQQVDGCTISGIAFVDVTYSIGINRKKVRNASLKIRVGKKGGFVFTANGNLLIPRESFFSTGLENGMIHV